SLSCGAPTLIGSELVNHIQGEKIDESTGELAGHGAQNGASTLMNGHFARVHEFLRKPQCYLLAVCVLYSCTEAVLIADRKSDRAHCSGDSRIVEGKPARQHPLRHELVLRAGGDVERILEVQVLAQAPGVPRIDADVHKSELAPVLPAD